MSYAGSPRALSRAVVLLLAATAVCVASAVAAPSAGAATPTITELRFPTDRACPAGSTLVKDRFDNVTGGLGSGTTSETFTVDGRTVAVTVTWYADNSFDITVSGGVMGGLFVKGPGFRLYDFGSDGAASGTGLHNSTPTRDGWSDVSHLDFCVKTGTVTPPPSPAGASDVSITKTANLTSVGRGGQVTYTLTASNAGPDAAADVALDDVLPSGVTFVSAGAGCTYTGPTRTVSCRVGTVGAGASAARTVTVKVDGTFPLTTSVQRHDHWLTVVRAERHLDVQPGATVTETVTCDGGAIATDGSSWVQHVDQGTGTLTDVDVVRSRSIGLSTYEFTLTNRATGRAQTKLLAACVNARTADATGHAHALHVTPAGGAPTTSSVSAPGAGRHDFTVICKNGSIPVAPGFAFTSGAGRSVGSELGSDGRSWHFTIQTTGPADIELSWRCLNRQTSKAAKHSHPLQLEHVVQTVQVAAGQASAMHKVSCRQEDKGIVATYDLPDGVALTGNLPVPVAREFHLLNHTGGPLAATLDLVCLSTRTGAPTSKATLTNTATVSASSTDTNTVNNTASATVRVTGTSAKRTAKRRTRTKARTRAAARTRLR